MAKKEVKKELTHEENMSLSFKKIKKHVKVLAACLIVTDFVVIVIGTVAIMNAFD